MYEIVQRRMIVPNLHELVVRAPAVARSVAPGQFVIVRVEEHGERVPLSVADWDAEAGTVTSIFMQVGASTAKLARLKPGDAIPTYAGPLGRKTEIGAFGTVVCVGGCYGIGSIYPIARDLKRAGNKVYAFLEARGGYLLYWEDKLTAVSDGVFIVTRDGTKGRKGHIDALPEIVTAAGLKPDRVIVNGCTFLLMRTSALTKALGWKTIVSMNPIMIDGTGMCGGCRVTVGGEVKFACVDGPEFDARQVDFVELARRNRAYKDHERRALEHHHCRIGLDVY